MKQQQGEAQEKQTKKRNLFAIHFVAGGIAGATGAIITCPLDVVQTRLQSSVVNLKSARPILNNVRAPLPVVAQGVGTAVDISSRPFGRQVFSYIVHIVHTEGFAALYKGLVPNLLGITPSRAIYFSVYSNIKHFLCNTSLSHSPWTHMLSALFASWSVSTITNPLWFLKTRLQLDLTECGKRRSIVEVVKDVFIKDGISGFYRGLSASYVGASETVLYFVIYERMKQTLSSKKGDEELNLNIVYACSAFCAKTIATISVYPHEVVRTRLRQESSSSDHKKLYRGFVQTFRKVYLEEGWVGLYGGMGAHLMRQVPNTVIMFLAYESIVNFLSQD